MKQITWEYSHSSFNWYLIIDHKVCYVAQDTYLDHVPDINGQILFSDLENACRNLRDFIRYKAGDDVFKTFCDSEDIKEVKAILNSLTNEEWEEIFKKMIRGYGWEYGIVDRQFEFDGLIFEAVGNILGGYKARSNAIIYDNSNNILQRKIDYKAFYKKARKEHLSCDVYRIIGDYENYYMLGSNTIFKVNLDGCKFKTCDEYPNRYRN